jgi:hypothetical protein
LLQWPATGWTSQRCYDGRQRITALANVALRHFFFLIFFYSITSREKKMGERKNF